MKTLLTSVAFALAATAAHAIAIDPHADELCRGQKNPMQCAFYVTTCTDSAPEQQCLKEGIAYSRKHPDPGKPGFKPLPSAD